MGKEKTIENQKKKIIEDFSKLEQILEEYCNVANDLAKTISDVVKKIIGIRLRWVLNFSPRYGVKTICFFNSSREIQYLRRKKKDISSYVEFEDVITSIFYEHLGFGSFTPYEYRIEIVCPYGVLLKPEEAKKLKEVLKEVNNEN